MSVYCIHVITSAASSNRLPERASQVLLSPRPALASASIVVALLDLILCVIARVVLLGSIMLRA